MIFNDKSISVDWLAIDDFSSLLEHGWLHLVHHLLMVLLLLGQLHLDSLGFMAVVGELLLEGSWHWDNLKLRMNLQLVVAFAFAASVAFFFSGICVSS